MYKKDTALFLIQALPESQICDKDFDNGNQHLQVNDPPQNSFRLANQLKKKGDKQYLPYLEAKSKKDPSPNDGTYFIKWSVFSEWEPRRMFFISCFFIFNFV